MTNSARRKSQSGCFAETGAGRRRAHERRGLSAFRTAAASLTTTRHEAIPRSVGLLGYGAHYLSKTSFAAHALVHGELFDDPEVARATLEAEKLLSAQLNDAQPRLGAYTDGGVAGSGAAGSGAAIIRFGDTDVTLNIRLIPIGRWLSSGRAEC